MDDILHIYSRVSTKEQSESGTSLESQRTLGIKLSETIGIGYRVWDEGGKSSSKDDLDNRPVLVELLGEIDNGNIKHLYVWNTDRLSRNQKTWGMIRYKLNQNKVLLYTGSDSNPIDLSNPMDDLLVGLLSEISQYDNKLRTERFRLGKIRRVKDGGWLGGPSPFGYKVENKKLVVDEEESKWVRFIFEKISEGKSIREVRNELLKNGVKTRRKNNVWSDGSIVSLLGNSHYGGYYKMTDKKSRETITVECEAIVSKSLISDVKKIRERQSYSKGIGRSVGGNLKREYLLKGLLVCGGCGSLYGGKTNKNTYLSHYYCVSGERNWRETKEDKIKHCNHRKRNLKISDTDDLVWNSILEVIENSVLFKEDFKIEILSNSSVSRDIDLIQNEKKKLRKLDREIKEVNNTIVELETDRLLKKRSKDEVSRVIDNVERHKIDLERKRENIENIIKGNKENIKWVDWVNEFSDKITELRNVVDIGERRRFLNGLVDRIIVKSDNLKTNNLKVFFKVPYINDNLIWKDEKDKSKGYEVVKGKKTLIVDLDEKLKK